MQVNTQESAKAFLDRKLKALAQSAKFALVCFFPRLFSQKSISETIMAYSPPFMKSKSRQKQSAQNTPPDSPNHVTGPEHGPGWGEPCCTPQSAPSSIDEALLADGIVSEDGFTYTPVDDEFELTCVTTTETPEPSSKVVQAEEPVAHSHFLIGDAPDTTYVDVEDPAMSHRTPKPLPKKEPKEKPSLEKATTEMPKKYLIAQAKSFRIKVLPTWNKQDLCDAINKKIGGGD